MAKPQHQSGTLFSPVSGAVPFPSRTAGEERIARQERIRHCKELVQQIKTAHGSWRKHRQEVAEMLSLIWTGKLYHDTHPSSFKAWFADQGFDFTYSTACNLLKEQGAIVHRKGSSNTKSCNSTPEWHRKISWFLNWHNRLAKEKPQALADKVRLAILALDEALKALEKA